MDRGLGTNSLPQQEARGFPSPPSGILMEDPADQSQPTGAAARAQSTGAHGSLEHRGSRLSRVLFAHRSFPILGAWVCLGASLLLSGKSGHGPSSQPRSLHTHPPPPGFQQQRLRGRQPRLPRPAPPPPPRCRVAGRSWRAVCLSPGSLFFTSSLPAPVQTQGPDPESLGPPTAPSSGSLRWPDSPWCPASASIVLAREAPEPSPKFAAQLAPPQLAPPAGRPATHRREKALRRRPEPAPAASRAVHVPAP
ncbi:hypothetical protein CB1_000424008 [Camelus ferus]|nr:hypothetical protein CB1_000424008 [Camelus ferus]